MGLQKLLIVALAGCLSGGVAFAQARTEATGVQDLQLSAWGALTGDFTGLNGGRNLGFSAGADLSVHPHHRFFPSIEVRGTYAIDQGHVVGERDLLGGIKVERHFRGLKPYLDIEFGRGQLNYVTPLPNSTGTFYYIQTTSNVLAPGGGIDLTVSHHFDFKADVQLQRWSSPVTAGNHFYSTPVTLGVVYKFDFNHGRMP